MADPKRAITRDIVPDEGVVSRAERWRAGEEPPARAEGLGVSFKTPKGLRLAGELLVPEGPGPHPVVVVAGAVAQTLCAQGMAAFLFDWTGCGDSEGDRAQCNPGQQLEDMRAAVEALGAFDELDGTRVALAGLGSGVPAATRAGAEDPRIRALVLIAPDPEAAAAGAAPPRVPVLRLTDAREAARAATWLRKQMA